MIVHRYRIGTGSKPFRFPFLQAHTHISRESRNKKLDLLDSPGMNEPVPTGYKAQF